MIANFRTVLQTQYLDHLIEFDKDNGVLTCESGITIKIYNLIVPNDGLYLFRLEQVATLGKR